MNDEEAVRALSALSQEVRIRLFAELVRAEPTGVTPTQLSADLNVPTTTLSFHLKELLRADLIKLTRSGRCRLYRVSFPEVGRLVQYLTDDLCAGQVVFPDAAPAPALQMPD